MIVFILERMGLIGGEQWLEATIDRCGLVLRSAGRRRMS